LEHSSGHRPKQRHLTRQSGGMRYAKNKARLHQASFRDAVLAAYKGRCAISHLPEPRLLDAAHIVMDADEQLGQPIVSNGLPLTKLHHAAFDAQLIGIDPDLRIHVSDRLLEIHDGPFLELGLKKIWLDELEKLINDLRASITPPGV
jgi:predicted restriction endonuclease